MILERLGMENFDGVREDLARLEIDADYEATGVLEVAVEPHECDHFEGDAEALRRFGHHAEVIDGAQTGRSSTHPPTSVASGSRRGRRWWIPASWWRGCAHAPSRPVRGSSRSTRVLEVTDAGNRLTLRTDAGSVRARRVLLATSAYPPLLRSLRRYIAPVYDYVLVTEPLSAEQLASVGWSGRHGVADCGNQFHYYRMTADHRILWGGYDAVYRYGGPVSAKLDEHEPTFGKLSEHFFATFPQLAGIRFSHRWGGAIDTCTRFSVFFGPDFGGRLAYAVGYTGLGVGASRFGARVALDLVDGRTTEVTELGYVRSARSRFHPSRCARR